MNWAVIAVAAVVLCAVPWSLWRGVRTGGGFWFVLADALTLLGCVLLHDALAGAAPAWGLQA